MSDDKSALLELLREAFGPRKDPRCCVCERIIRTETEPYDEHGDRVSCVECADEYYRQHPGHRIQLADGTAVVLRDLRVYPMQVSIIDAAPNRLNAAPLYPSMLDAQRIGPRRVLDALGFRRTKVRARQREHGNPGFRRKIRK